MRARRRSPVRAAAADERGAVAIIAASMLVILFLSVAFVIDIGTQVGRRQAVRNATDSSVLAASALLPKDPTGAKALAIKYALDNDPNLTASALDISFACLVGDRDGDGLPDPGDIPGSCNPGLDGMGLFTCDRGVCVAPCDPGQGDSCNTIQTRASEEIGFRIAPAGGVSKQGTTGLVTSAACSGLCGASPKIPLDIGIVIDRTASMSATDLRNAKDAALAALGFLDPVYHRVALGVIHQSSSARSCAGGGFGRSISDAEYAASSGTFIAAPFPSGGLYSDYQHTDGTLNDASTLVKTVKCLETSSFNTPTGQTDIGSPIAAMTNLLQTRGRAGVDKVIVLETDGEANLPAGSQPCGFAVNKAALAKTANIEVFTIGFGIGGKRCVQDRSGSYVNGLVTKVLADAATQPSADNGCVAAENTDGDHFFCEPKSGDLSAVFVRVVSAVVGHARLVRVPQV
jgi:hypothetical protein